jgi:signal transduction histidine kinase
MGSLVYIRLIGYTAGTLLQLFWMVVILGYRRQRNFERVFFFLCLALFLFYSGSLLALNAQIYYPVPPEGLTKFVVSIIVVGLSIFPALLLHLHLEFAGTRGLIQRQWWKWAQMALAYLPVPFFLWKTLDAFFHGHIFNFVLPLNSFGPVFLIWASAMFLLSGGWEREFATKAESRSEIHFHAFLSVVLFLTWGYVLFRMPFSTIRNMSAHEVVGTIVALLPILPLTALIYYVQRHNFLQIGRQRNLLYAVSATFLALLYLSLVRRVSTLLEPLLPPEASASILLFVLVVFIEPLQRTLGSMLRETAQREMEVVHRVAQEILEEAKHGDLARLVGFVEDRVTKSFELSQVKLSLGEKAIAQFSEANGKPSPGSESQWKPPYFPLMRGDLLLGVLRAEPHGAVLSGDTRAALEYLCEQLPGALDLCRLIHEKLLLERELAERERLAVLGQMAASISHNLKNPLGSIKTILQVQIENPDLPNSVRAETKMVLEEIGRLSGKLNQLLQFSRPAVLGDPGLAKCDAVEVARQVAGVLQHDAQRKGIALELRAKDATLELAATTEAVNDMLTNLVVNAIDAAPSGGHVHIEIEQKDGQGLLAVEDDGAGVPAALREKILQPFFTTKTQGTGLGLAIVARRASDAGGRVELESPVADGRGTRFVVWLPLGEEKR